MNKSSPIEDMQRIINQSGGKATEIAKKEILSRFAPNDDVSLALRYFAGVTLRDALPVFPALVSLSCEAVGGTTDKTDSIGGAITLIAGAADLHDDVIDQSPIKNGKPTVLGKFGKELTILAGDALLVLGLERLQEGCKSLPREQGSLISDLVTYAILKMTQAEAFEARLRTEKKLSAKDCMKIIESKAVVPEVNAKIGAILGNARAESLEALGHFGKTFGIVSTVAEEFMDVLESTELKNRITNDYPPLPVLLAIQEARPDTEAKSLAKKLSARKSSKIRELVLSSSKNCDLKNEMKILVQSEIEMLSSSIKEVEPRRKLKILLTASIELLEGVHC